MPESPVVPAVRPTLDTGPDGSTPRVLIVDDTAVVRRAMRFMLERLGYAVVEAPGGEEALAAVEAQRFDAVVLDFHLVGHRGDSVYHAACDLRPELRGRTVFVSGDPDAERCYPARVERCPVLAKPFAPADLAGAVARAREAGRDD
ncbi:MAG TPA: response regulator [Gemmatimonadaceae bacterium]|nr:response regulator [Gemmatimonadaceae bacterium]